MDDPATVADVHRVAAGMPHVTVYPGDTDRPVYQVGGKSFVFFRSRRPDTVDPDTGERYDDVIVFWVAGEEDKQALLQSGPPYFTTRHFDGHPSVLVRASQLARLSRAEVTELVQDAWLSRASRRRAGLWLADHGLPDDRSG
ncbi:MmcQ/YjbR family DNA-binding protein [Nakamurella sp.]|uniref:MmcQ/YjbR family DNA-binding protein n=1 Tax=Nakamurella sp. TaxID=1869182 RepID=UPI003B3BD5E1